MKPFSQACENNKQPILDVLCEYFLTTSDVLEIGSGTGQHAVHFAANLPHLNWQTSDQLSYHRGINLWIDSVSLNNIGRPVELDVMQDEQWDIKPAGSEDNFDGIFSANTAHIMPWVAVVEMFRGAGRLLAENGRLVLYGPFNHDGEFTSASNVNFHNMLVNQNPSMGIRDDCDVFNLGRKNSLALIDDITMPANNRVLVFSKSAI